MRPDRKTRSADELLAQVGSLRALNHNLETDLAKVRVQLAASEKKVADALHRIDELVRDGCVLNEQLRYSREEVRRLSPFHPQTESLKVSLAKVTLDLAVAQNERADALAAAKVAQDKLASYQRETDDVSKLRRRLFERSREIDQLMVENGQLKIRNVALGERVARTVLPPGKRARVSLTANHAPPMPAADVPAAEDPPPPPTEEAGDADQA